MSFRVNTNVTAMNALRNVGGTSFEFSKSITRLSTGLRINSAADDPAGLIISENFRAQIGGLQQAIRNNQDAVNYAKTAEGAMDEISRLLRDARSLAVSSSNSAVMSAPQLQANQTQLDSIVSSITRISQQTQFGTRRLLDGSSGVNAAITNGTRIGSISMNGMLNGVSLMENSAIDIDVTTAAAKASSLQTRVIAVADVATASTTTVAQAGSFTINGQTFGASATDTYGSLVQKINEASSQTGVVADLVLNGANDVRVQLRSVEYGANARIDVTDANGVIRAAAGAASATGVNAVATMTVPTGGPGSTSVSATFTGGVNGASGLLLTDGAGNSIRLAEAGNATGVVAAVGQLTAGAAQFQIGANVGQRVSLSLGNFAAGTLGLTGLDLTSQNGADVAFAAIDAAIDRVSSARGEIGSFQRNVLESNIRSLGVAKENLSASESAIRDTDVAEEMSNYTKLQILQQAGMAVLAQANAAPQAVLSLLQ